MKTSKLFLVACLATSLSLVACGPKNASKDKAKTETTTETVMEIDDLLDQAEANVNKEVVFEGVCTHACSHGATKIFMMGSDNTKTIRVEAAELGAFDTKCVHNVVRVNGILREQRIDEAYLQNWEAEAKAETAEHHGEGEGGCASEKNARGEKGNSVEERIADFRTRIAARQESEGKAYLSFYFVEAKSYEIQ